MLLQAVRNTESSKDSPSLPLPLSSLLCAVMVVSPVLPAQSPSLLAHLAHSTALGSLPHASHTLYPLIGIAMYSALCLPLLHTLDICAYLRTPVYPARSCLSGSTYLLLTSVECTCSMPASENPCHLPTSPPVMLSCPSQSLAQLSLDCRLLRQGLCQSYLPLFHRAIHIV